MSEQSLFIDTGAFLAFLMPGDQYEEPAKKSWKLIEQNHYPLLSSEFILVETANFLVRQQSSRIASAWLDSMMDSKEIRLIHVEREDFRVATTFAKKYSDLRISMTDALSFALMKRQKVQRAFTFDKHFEFAGFEIWPGDL